MIRIITYLIITIFRVSISFGQITSEEILINNNGVKLPGTLTFSEQKTPLVIWVHGSGNIDRNGNQTPFIKANYIKQFRDSINKNNIAFFSYDKRTANKDNISFLKQGLFFNDFVSDVKKVVTYFKDSNRFSEIILIGHSQGSLVAMLASENIDKYISLAGPSDTVDKTMVRQVIKQNPIMGEFVKRHFKELKETGTIKEVNPMLVSIFSKQNLPFLKSWASYNPSEEIKKITVPILIINGTKDLQVRVIDAENLHKAKPISILKIIERMNHVLKKVDDKDNLKSYYSAEYPLSKELIKTVVDFIKNKHG